MDANIRIKKRRIELGLTMLQVAEMVGVSEATISRWESGDIANMKRDKIKKLAEALKVSFSYIMDDDTNEFDKVGTPYNPMVHKIPVLGNVAAGIPIEAIEDIVDYEEISEEMASRGQFFGLKIKGSSMEPRIKDGDVVIVRQQPEVESGDVAIVVVNGDSATCKEENFKIIKTY